LTSRTAVKSPKRFVTFASSSTSWFIAPLRRTSFALQHERDAIRRTRRYHFAGDGVARELAGVAHAERAHGERELRALERSSGHRCVRDVLLRNVHEAERAALGVRLEPHHQRDRPERTAPTSGELLPRRCGQ